METKSYIMGKLNLLVCQKTLGAPTPQPDFMLKRKGSLH